MIARGVASPVVRQVTVRGETDRYRAYTRTDGRIAIVDLDRPFGDRTVLHVESKEAAELAIGRLAAGAPT